MRNNCPTNTAQKTKKNLNNAIPTKNDINGTGNSINGDRFVLIYQLVIPRLSSLTEMLKSNRPFRKNDFVFIFNQ